MADKLIAFLIDMAKSEEALSRFLKDPQGTAREAQVPKDQIKILMSRDAQTIFAELRGVASEGGHNVVWISPSTAKRAVRPAVKRRKTTSRRRR